MNQSKYKVFVMMLKDETMLYKFYETPRTIKQLKAYNKRLISEKHFNYIECISSISAFLDRYNWDYIKECGKQI